MVKKKLSYRNKRKSIIRKNTKRLKGRKALFRNKTKKLKKRKSQKKKINFQRGGAEINLNDYIKPASPEHLDDSIDAFIEDFLFKNKGKLASLMQSRDMLTYTVYGKPKRKIVYNTEEEMEELKRTTSPYSRKSSEINRENLNLFIHEMKNKDPTPDNYFNGAYIRDDGGLGTAPLTAEIQTGA